MAKRCVAYGRVSTNQEKQKTSLENQRLYYEEKFKGDGYLPSPFGMLYRRNGTTEPLPSMYIDEGISGTCIQFRKAFERMLEDAKKGYFEIIYVKSVSRFARNTVDGLQTVRELKRLGVGVIFEDWGINTLESDDEMLLTMAFGQAQNESQVKSRNVKFGIRQRQKDGKWFCNEPFGYKKIDKGLVIDEKEAATVRLIFDKYTKEDFSVHALSQYLNQHIDEHPTKKNKLWSRQQIAGILSNSIYVGLYKSHVCEKTGFMATDPAVSIPEKQQFIHELPSLQIIDTDVWDKAVGIMRARKARYSTVEQRGKNTNGYLLSTILFCKDCGTSFDRKKRHGGLKKDGTRTDLGYFWICRQYDLYGKKRCSNNFGINEPVAEEQVREEIRYLQKEIRERAGGALLTNFKSYLRVAYELDHNTVNIDAIREQLSKIERKKAILLEDRIDGLMSKEMYQKEVKLLNDEAEKLEDRIKESSLFEDNMKREWARFEKYKSMILSLDPENLTNGEIKQVFNRIYVGAKQVEGRKRPVKYLIFSYAIMGCTVEEMIQMYYDKGYADETTKIDLSINSGVETGDIKNF